MVGILVHGNNHFILGGPPPTDMQAIRLARQWAVVQIGEMKAASFEQWEIRDKEFRENLQWAVIVPGDRAISPGVAQLLSELSARGIVTRKCHHGCW